MKKSGCAASQLGKRKVSTEEEIKLRDPKYLEKSAKCLARKYKYSVAIE
jgi:hypothetical protein